MWVGVNVGWGGVDMQACIWDFLFLLLLLFFCFCFILYKKLDLRRDHDIVFFFFFVQWGGGGIKGF